MPWSLRAIINKLKEILSKTEESIVAVPPPDDDRWYDAAESLQSSFRDALVFVSTLKPEDTSIAYAVLEYLCVSMEESDAAVRAEILEATDGTLVVEHIMSLVRTSGQHAPSVRAAGVALLHELVYEQSGETLERVMTSECFSLLLNYMKPNSITYESLNNVVGIFKAMMGSRNLIAAIMRAGFVTTTYSLLKNCVSKSFQDEDFLLMHGLWQLYKAAEPHVPLHATELVGIILDKLESDSGFAGPCDMRKVMLLECLERVPSLTGTSVNGSAKNICTRILAQESVPENVAEQLIALCVITKIFSAPTRVPTKFSEDKVLEKFLNKNCQVCASDAFEELLRNYEKVVQMYHPENAVDLSVVYEVIGCVLLKVSRRWNILADCAKRKMLKMLDSIHSSGCVISKDLCEIHYVLACTVLTFPEQQLSLCEVVLQFILKHALQDEEFIRLYTPEYLIKMLLTRAFGDSLQVCQNTITALCIVLKHASSGEALGIPEQLRRRVLQHLVADNFLALQQNSLNQASKDILKMVITDREALQACFGRPLTAFWLNIFNVEKMPLDESRRKQQLDWRLRFLVELVLICEWNHLSPPDSMVQAIKKIKKDHIEEMLSTLRTCERYDDALELSLRWATLVVCEHTRFNEANEVFERIVLERRNKPQQPTEEFTTFQGRLGEELQKLKAENEERNRNEKLLLEEEPPKHGGSAMGKTCRRKKKKAGAAAAVAGAAEQPVPVSVPERAGAAAAAESPPPEAVLPAPERTDAAGAGAAEQPLPVSECADAAVAATEAEAPEPKRTGAECAVCLNLVEKENRVACVPCGHVCMCFKCASAMASAMKPCPICRTGIEKVVKLYFCYSKPG